MPEVEVAHGRIHYDDSGAGEVVLLIHGGMFELMDAERFWARPGVVDDLLATGRRVLLPFRRFSGGRTAADVAAHDWDVEAVDMAAVIRHAGAEQADVAGGSMGCSIGIRLALREPGLVRSLALCWPGEPDADEFVRLCEGSAAWVAEHGPAAYVDLLDREGFPKYGEDRPGFPFGVALLHDERARRSFLALSPAAAARVIRDSAAALAPGLPLQGMRAGDGAALGRLSVPVGVVPADPEDPWHTRAAAEVVVAAIPGSRLLAGSPVTPSPRFPEYRAGFASTLGAWFSTGKG